MKLKDRNPRNRMHVHAALKIIHKHLAPRVTSEGARLMTVFGAPASLKVLVSDVPRSKERAVCPFFFLDHGFLLANNVLGTCCVCHVPLQMRPSSSVLTERICVFCAAEQCLAEAAKPDGSRQGGQRSR